MEKQVGSYMQKARWFNGTADCVVNLLQGRSVKIKCYETQQGHMGHCHKRCHLCTTDKLKRLMPELHALLKTSCSLRHDPYSVIHVVIC